MIDSSNNNKRLNKFYPLVVGLMIYLVFIPLMTSGLGEGTFQIAFLLVNILGGWFAGKLGGTDGIIGIMIFSFIVLAGYIIFQFIEPDSLWIIGLLFLGFTQALFWGGWLFGSLLYKEKSTT